MEKNFQTENKTSSKPGNLFVFLNAVYNPISSGANGP